MTSGQSACRCKGIGYLRALLALVVLLFATALTAAEKNRDRVPETYRWNLAELYPTVEEWQREKQTYPQRFSEVAALKGTLGRSAANLYSALERIHQLHKDFDKFWSYASMRYDQDTRVAQSMTMNQTASRLGADLRAKLSYLSPEILAIDPKKMRRFFRQEPRLAKYRRFIEDIRRMRPHTLSQAEERVIAQAGLMADTPSSVHSVFSNADLPYPTVELSDGQKARLDVATYSRWRYSHNRRDRKRVFEAFFGALGRYRRTLGTLLSGKIRQNLFYKNVGKYPSCLEMVLFRNHVTKAVYTKIIEGVHAHLPLLHRYLKIRKRMLGVDQLHYYDFYPDLVKDVDVKFPYKEAQRILKSSLKVLGKGYVAVLDKAFNNRWIDVYPNTGKDSGAYCNYVYDVHPYVQLNYNDRFADMSLMAHELGHAVHGVFSSQNQPYVDSDPASLTAEIAATTSDVLMASYVIDNEGDPKRKLSLIGSWLEAFRQTVFRQALFAEFEWNIYQRAERGESLSGDLFSQIYLDLLRKYYGHAEGVAVIDDVYGHEWGYISHFYIGFYNYYYSISYAAALALAEMMKTGGDQMVRRYSDFLSKGTVEPPIPMLRKLGVDMTSDKPFRLAMGKMKGLLDEMERLLGKK